jgi:hypothetical protein
LKALRWTEEVGTDLIPPQPGELGNRMIKGFLFSTYGNGEVKPACSSSVYHNYGSSEKTTTQGSRSLYSTRLLALKGLRGQVEYECAKKLARIDVMIEAERDGKPS